MVLAGIRVGYDAIAIMAHRQVGALIVAYEGRVAGIVTKRDYARKIVLTERSSRDTPARDIMSTAVRYVSLQQTTDECMALVTGAPDTLSAGDYGSAGDRNSVNRQPDREPEFRVGTHDPATGITTSTAPVFTSAIMDCRRNRLQV
jgi:CBS domain-containing protein